VTARGSLVVVSAPSGGGKSSLTRALLPWLATRGVTAQISVSFTTRAPRAGEEDGGHYHFVTPQAFAARVAAQGFLEHADVFGRQYGTARDETDALLARGIDVILDIDWQGLRQLRQQRPDVASVFILPPSIAALDARLRARGQDADDVIAARMAQASAEISHHDEYDHLVINDDFDLALEALGAIFLERRQRRDGQVARHRALIRELLVGRHGG